MTSQEAKGSFMSYFDVVDYFALNNHDFDNLWESIVEIDGRSYLPTEIVSNRISNMAFRKMECIVVTSMFGLNSINL